MSSDAQMPLFSPTPPAAPSPGATSRAGDGDPAAATRLAVCNLGSGSGGNCTALKLGDRAVLIDAGFGPRTTERRLAQAKLGLDNVAAICLTHLDRDHFRPTWSATLQRHRIPILLHHWHLPQLRRLPGGAALCDAGLVTTFDGKAFEPVPGLTAHGYRCQHDRQGTISFRFESRAGCIGYATDLGHVPAELIEHLAGVDLLALECNYDEHMTIHSSRPAWVNRRNMSDSGHLSNDQALEAVQRIDALSPGANPRHVLLLHRSSQCNHPMKVRRTFERVPHLTERITLTEQRRRTRWLHISPARAAVRCQLPMRY